MPDRVRLGALMRERALFVALVLAHLVPVWSADYFPSMDGPAHVYNAWVLRHYGDPELPLLREHFEIDPRPLPNWFGHAALALLIGIVEPRTAEKVLVSALLVLFYASVRYLAGSVDPDRRWLAYLAFPLGFTRLLHIGFYNYLFGLAFALFALGLWWRRRARPGLELALKLNLLLLLAYASHVVPHVLALVSIGILWLSTLPESGWRHLRHVPVLAPQAVLPLWFVLSVTGGVQGSEGTAPVLRAQLFRLEVLDQFGDLQVWIGTILAVAFLALAALTLRGRLAPGRGGLAPEDGFLIASFAVVLLYFLGPSGFSSEGPIAGGYIKMRLTIVPYLLLIPWLAPRLGRAARSALVGGLVLLALVHVGYLVRSYRSLEGDYRAFLAGAEALPAESRAVPLVFDLGPHRLFLNLFSYAAIEKGAVDWTNYEAVSRLFPLRFREVHRRKAERLYRRSYQRALRENELGPVEGVDAVFCWKLLPGSDVARDLERHYRLADSRGPARVYVSPGGQSPAFPETSR